MRFTGALHKVVVVGPICDELYLTEIPAPMISSVVRGVAG